MENNELIESLKKELAEIKKLYRESRQSELMYQNMLHFILDNEVPESKLADFKARIA